MRSRTRTIAKRLLPTYRRSIGRVTNTLFQMDLLESTNSFADVSWLGVPVWQDVLDLWSLQEEISALQPDLYIETGTYQGGSSLFVAHLFDLMGHGEVITIDVDKQHELSHPRVTYLVGSSTSPEIVSQVAERAAAATGHVMATLDSDHSEAHVYNELDAYAPMITVGSTILVQDGIIDTLNVPGTRALRPGPVPAIKRFLAENSTWASAERNGRWPITTHPMGWLRKQS